MYIIFKKKKKDIYMYMYVFKRTEKTPFSLDFTRSEREERLVGISRSELKDESIRKAPFRDRREMSIFFCFF